MTKNGPSGYVPLKEAYVHVIRDGDHTKETIDLYEERIRQAGAMGELRALIVAPSGNHYDLCHTDFSEFLFSNSPPSSAGKAIVFDITTNKEEIVNGRIFINLADLQKVGHGIRRDLTRYSAPIPQEIDMSKPRAKEFDDILEHVAYVKALPAMQGSRETDCFKKAKNDFKISLSESTIKNIWNGSYSVSSELGFTKDYIKRNYHKG